MDDNIPTPIYWGRASWDLSRSAYLADLDADPDGPGSWIRWFRRALEEHIGRGPQARSRLEVQEPEGRRAGRGGGFNKTHLLPPGLAHDLEDALIADRREAGRMVSRSGFAREAVIAAASAARRRNGGTLPPPPGKLSNRPPR